MKLLNMVVILVLMIMLSACGEAAIEKVNSSPAASNAAVKPSNETSPEPKTPEIYNVGDSVKFDDLIITVNGVKESNGSEFLAPKDGYVYLLVDVTAENKGEEEASVSSMLQTEVVDGDGYSYDVTFGADAKGNFDGSVGVGRKLRGEIVYEVPKDVSSLEFIFSDPFKTGQAIWKIK